jgi:HNH endonuclease
MACLPGVHELDAWTSACDVRTGQLRTVSGAMETTVALRGRIPGAVVDVVRMRAGGRCEVCGVAFGYDDDPFCGPALHHRKLRSQGGGHTPENLMLLHGLCHNLGSGAVHLNVAWSRERGYLVPSWADPDTTPVLLHGTDPMWLRATYATCTQDEVDDWLDILD